MRYVSIDIETTGLNEIENQIVEFGAIIEDTKNPKPYEESKKYRRIVLARDLKYVFSSFAAKMNVELIATIAKIENGAVVPFENNPFLTQTVLFGDELIADFKIWLLANGFKENGRGVVEIVAAGKNFSSFDKRFIQALPEFESHGLRFNHRSLDPTLIFINWDEDTTPPSTDVCKQRVNLSGAVKHEALSDAWDIIELLRINYVPAKSPIIPT